MVSFEEAISNVRKKFPDCKVCEGSEFKGKYIFSLGPKEKLPNPSGFFVTVEKDDGIVQVFDDSEKFGDPNKWNELTFKYLMDDDESARAQLDELIAPWDTAWKNATEIDGPIEVSDEWFE